MNDQIKRWRRQVATWGEKANVHTCAHGAGERDDCRDCDNAGPNLRPVLCPHGNEWGDDCPGCSRAGGIRKQRLRQYGDAFEVWLND
jgi:hypothetical protein